MDRYLAKVDQYSSLCGLTTIWYYPKWTENLIKLDPFKFIFPKTDQI